MRRRFSLGVLVAHCEGSDDFGRVAGHDQHPNAGSGGMQSPQLCRKCQAQPRVFQYKGRRITEFASKRLQDELPVHRPEHPVQPIGFEREADIPDTFCCQEDFVVCSDDGKRS